MVLQVRVWLYVQMKLKIRIKLCYLRNICILLKASQQSSSPWYVSGSTSLSDSCIAETGTMARQYNRLGASVSAISLADRSDESSASAAITCEGTVSRISRDEPNIQNRTVWPLRRGVGGNCGEESAAVERHESIHNAERDASVPGAIVAPGVN